jgi:hypothetical protein
VSFFDPLFFFFGFGFFHGGRADLVNGSLLQDELKPLLAKGNFGLAREFRFSGR